MAKGMHYHCPVNGWDCPYYVDTLTIEGQEEYCLCGMGLEHPTHANLDPDVGQLDPYEECDDFFSMWEGCPSMEYTDYVDED